MTDAPKGRTTARREPYVEIRRRELKSGRVVLDHRVRWWDDNGVKHAKSHPSAEEADLHRAQLLLDQRAGRVPEEELGKSTLTSFHRTWRDDIEDRLEQSTIESYDDMWLRLIEPRFGAWPMADITPRTVAKWRQDLVATGVGRESVRRAMVVLQSMFTLAIEWGEASSNPVAVVRKPRRPVRGAVRPVTPDEIEAVRRQFVLAADLNSADLVAVLAYAGTRPGEALALERRHVGERTLLVEQAAADGRIKEQKTGRAYRSTDLLDPLREDLVARIARHGPSGLLFARTDGSPWHKDDWNNWRNRAFHPAVREAGVDLRRPYDLRHSFASLLIRQGLSVVDVADQLGHSGTETLKTYAHVFREFRGEGAIDPVALIRAARARY